LNTSSNKLHFDSPKALSTSDDDFTGSALLKWHVPRLNSLTL
jgi:hypothetical protein